MYLIRNVCSDVHIYTTRYTPRHLAIDKQVIFSNNININACSFELIANIAKQQLIPKTIHKYIYDCWHRFYLSSLISYQIERIIYIYIHIVFAHQSIGRSDKGGTRDIYWSYRCFNGNRFIYVLT